MKILILDQFSEPGGAQLCVRDLAPEIARRQWHATFMAPGDGAVRGSLEELGIKNERLPGLVYNNGRKSVRDVARYGLDIARVLAGIARFTGKNRPEYRRMAADVTIQAGLGRFFGAKFRSAALYRIYEQTVWHERAGRLTFASDGTARVACTIGLEARDEGVTASARSRNRIAWSAGPGNRVATASRTGRCAWESESNQPRAVQCESIVRNLAHLLRRDIQRVVKAASVNADVGDP